jgi:D-alanine-D-alanine ligase
VKARFGKVAVLFGGSSAEREISLMSGAAVLAALQAAGVDAHAFDPAERDLHVLKEEGFERAFIALHGRGGEDGTVQGALELMGIPYTGSGVMASALSWTSGAPRWCGCRRLPTPRYAILQADSDWDAVVAELGLPLFVKPAREGSSVGATKVTRRGQLRAAWELAARYDRWCSPSSSSRRRSSPPLPRRPGAAAGAHRRAGRQLRLPEQVLHRRHAVLLPERPARRAGGDPATW